MTMKSNAFYDRGTTFWSNLFLAGGAFLKRGTTQCHWEYNRFRDRPSSHGIDHRVKRALFLEAMVIGWGNYELLWCISLENCRRPPLQQDPSSKGPQQCERAAVPVVTMQRACRLRNSFATLKVSSPNPAPRAALCPILICLFLAFLYSEVPEGLYSRVIYNYSPGSKRVTISFGSEVFILRCDLVVFSVGQEYIQFKEGRLNLT